MSKAIYGHLGGSDALLLAEVTRLRRRVRELEEQVAAYEAELVGSPVRIVSLHEAELDAALRELGTTEPALT
jgi:adenylate kinase